PAVAPAVVQPGVMGYTGFQQSAALQRTQWLRGLAAGIPDGPEFAGSAPAEHHVHVTVVIRARRGIEVVEPGCSVDALLYQRPGRGANLQPLDSRLVRSSAPVVRAGQGRPHRIAAEYRIQDAEV